MAHPLHLKALQWLAQREHSPAELRTKLMQWVQKNPAVLVQMEAPDGVMLGATPAGRELAERLEPHLNAVLENLEQQGWLNGSRFVESRLNQRSPRHGLRRIEVELSHHGLELSSEQREQLQLTEEDRLRQAWHRKFGRQAGVPATPQERIRQMRYLQQRGFDAQAIGRWMKTLQNQPAEV
jgi:regulatory protein